MKRRLFSSTATIASSSSSSSSSASASASSLLSLVDPSVFQRYLHLCTRIEGIIQQDIGKRNIQSLIIPHDLARAGIAYLLSTRIGILTGFPCRIASSPPSETDGPTGALYLAYGGQRLGKSTGIVTDDSSRTVLEPLVYYRNHYTDGKKVQFSTSTSSRLSVPSSSSIALDTFPSNDQWLPEHTRLLNNLVHRYDHMIAIERSGRSATPPGKLSLTDVALTKEHTAASESVNFNRTSSSPSSLADLYHRTKHNPSLYSYRTMKGNDMSKLVAPIDELLIEHTEIYDELLSPTDTLGSNQTKTIGSNPNKKNTDDVSSVPSSFHSLLARHYPRTSTGIGDGGNECGMGKVYTQVQRHIPYGSVIASVIPTDNLVTCGVSHWGSYGLLAAVEALVRYRIFPLSVIPCIPGSSSSSSSSSSSAFFLLPTLTVAPSSFSMETSLLPTPDDEFYFTTIMNRYGAADGITNSFDQMIDGLPITTHIDVLERIRTLLREEFVN